MYYAATNDFNFSFEYNCLYNTGFIRAEGESSSDVISIYPNPVSSDDEIVIEAPAKSIVKFYSIIGNELLKLKTVNAVTKISSADLPTGFIIYIITLPSGKSVTGKLIVE